jgi:DnaJ-class molecular chaperone
VTQAGEVVTVNKRPCANRGFRKGNRVCTVCNGTGTEVDPVIDYGVAVCSGCNGHGYVKEWRKEQ